MLMNIAKIWSANKQLIQQGAHTRDVYVRSPGVVSHLALTTSVLAPEIIMKIQWNKRVREDMIMQ